MPYIFTGDMMCIAPQAVSFSPPQTVLALVAAGIIAVVVPALMTISVADARAGAERHLLVQGWHLEKMVQRARERKNSVAGRRPHTAQRHTAAAQPLGRSRNILPNPTCTVITP